MEVWAPPDGHAAKALEAPLRCALRAALGVPVGEARTMYPVHLMHYDTAIRPFASDNRASHVRYWQRVRTLPASRLQRCALGMLAPRHPWLQRVRSWRDEIVAADPEAPIVALLVWCNMLHIPWFSIGTLTFNTTTSRVHDVIRDSAISWYWPHASRSHLISSASFISCARCSEIHFQFQPTSVSLPRGGFALLSRPPHRVWFRRRGLRNKGGGFRPLRDP